MRSKPHVALESFRKLRYTGGRLAPLAELFAINLMQEYRPPIASKARTFKSIQDLWAVSKELVESISLPVPDDELCLHLQCVGASSAQDSYADSDAILHDRDGCIGVT